MSYRRNFEPIRNPFSAVVSVLVMLLVLVGLFFIAKFIFKLLWWVAPLIFIASLIIDVNVFLDYTRWVGRLFRRSIWMGLGTIVLSMLFFPFLGMFFLGKALLRKRIREAQRDVQARRQGEFINYEEVDSEPLDLDRLPPEHKEPREPSRRQPGSYDQFFE